MTRGLFISGTDTGVGKTVVACAIARGLVRRGLDVGVLKPAETGVGADGPLDARALRQAAGAGDPLERVCPQQFALPAAPTVAAAAESRDVDLGAMDAAFQALRASHEILLVEGAGGLLVPVTAKLCMADLAARWDLPVVVAARAALGTINHTLLTLEALQRRGLALACVVVCHSGGPLSHADAANLAALRAALGALLVGEIPPLAPGAQPDTDALDLDALLDHLPAE